MNRWNLINRIAIVAAVALAVYAGCQSGTPNGLTTEPTDVASVGAVLPDVPMEFAPGQTAERTNYIDVSSQLPEQDATDVAFGFEPASLAISVRPDTAAKAASPRKLTITLAIAEGAASTPCTSGVSAGRFFVDVAEDGSVSAITPERPRLGEIVATALRLGEVALCTKVEANFTGSIVIKETKIDVAFNGAGLGGTDDNVNANSGDNKNDNTADNTNGNTSDDNKNGNTDDGEDDNVNGNTDDDSNGNVDDDNSNTDDDSNGNADDNTNGNVDDDDNGNTDDNANANDNTDDNANDNTDDNANDNTDDNANDNTEDNANDNTDDNANDNTDDNANDNTDDNTNDNGNTNDNSNDNTSGGLCPDGSTRLEGEIDSPVELEAEYRLFPTGCTRFRVRVRDYVAGTHDIFVNGASVGTILVGVDGRGEMEFDTEDGNFPADFPLMALDDVVQVGSFSVTMGNDCSSDDVDTCNGNGNTNNNTNTNG